MMTRKNSKLLVKNQPANLSTETAVEKRVIFEPAYRRANMPTPANRFRILGLVVLCLVLAASGSQDPRVNPDLTAHEWGTFTSIAGRDGQPVKWSPLNGSAELPSFVEHLNGAQFKAGLHGTVRMETPVLYFYSPRETAVSVKVAFSKGVITEWYPHASRVEPNPNNVLDCEALFQRRASGTISWDSVTVSPNLAASFPRGSLPGDEEDNQYYAARETSAAPLSVRLTVGDQHVRTYAGYQQEKFLFYRGVSTFSLPISATVTPEGKVSLTNLAKQEIPSVILFERRGDKLGYRLGGALQSEMSLDPPELTATFDSMSRDLQEILTSQGLYPDEARAMIETWRQSWFEEGSRLFYIVPSGFLNQILPLTIHPAPSQTVRVFVGRLELITPATTQAVEKILATHDIAGLQKYNRFLEAILDEMKAANPEKAKQIDNDLDLTYSSPLIEPQITQPHMTQPQQPK
jgi:hypothetical protein